MIPVTPPAMTSTNQFFTDASRKYGFGGFWRGQYFYGLWTEEERAWDINVLELATLVFAVETWGNRCSTPTFLLDVIILVQ